jgi:Lipase (class 3)
MLPTCSIFEPCILFLTIDIGQVSYGSPRVGNQATANAIVAGAGLTVRVTHTNDIITTVPPRTLSQYRHTPGYFQITSPTGRIPGLNDITFRQGEDTTINSANVVTLGNAHTFYFNPISACARNPSVFIPFTSLPLRVSGGEVPPAY